MLLLAALPAGAGSVEAAAPRIGSTLLPLTLLDVKGMPIRIPESVRGKVLVLHFWQIGCSSCELEMPAMDGLYSQYRRRGLEILAVNVGQKNELVQKFAVELGVSYPLLIDAQGKSAALYGATDVPRTYVTDRKGVIRYRILGGVAPETLRRLILSLL
jgi:peroxiredoxin